MEKVFNNRDIGYTIISRFEDALRGLIKDKLVLLYGEKYIDGIPTGVQSKLRENSIELNMDDPMQILEETNFPDLMEIICFKNNYRNYLPDSDIPMKDFQFIMGELYTIRCKIAHIRGYFTVTDLDITNQYTKKLSKAIGSYPDVFVSVLVWISFATVS